MVKKISEQDITLVIDKKPPDLSVQHTVGGLRKIQAEKCWSILSSYGRFKGKYSHWVCSFMLFMFARVVETKDTHRILNGDSITTGSG